MLIWQTHRARVRHMAFDPAGAELATTAGESKFVSLWRAATGAPAGRLAGHTSYARAVAYSPDGRFVVSTQNEPTAHVWDRATGTVVGRLSADWGADSAALRPDSQGVAVVTRQGVAVWRCADFAGASQTVTPAARLATHRAVQQALYSPCGRYLIVNSYHWLRVYDADGRAELRALDDPCGSAAATQLAFAPDGNTLAVVFGLRVHLFSVPDGAEKMVLRGHTNYIHALGFMPDGRTLVSAGSDGAVRVWDAATGAETRSFDWGIGKVCAATVSPDGALCAAGSMSGQVVVWDVD